MTCPAEYQNVEEKQIVVWVDPLDGTKEYTEGTCISTVTTSFVNVCPRICIYYSHMYFMSGMG